MRLAMTWGFAVLFCLFAGAAEPAKVYADRPNRISFAPQTAQYVRFVIHQSVLPDVPHHGLHTIQPWPWPLPFRNGDKSILSVFRRTEKNGLHPRFRIKKTLRGEIISVRKRIDT